MLLNTEENASSGFAKNASVAAQETAKLLLERTPKPTTRVITDTDLTYTRKIRNGSTSTSQSPIHGSDLVRSPRKLSSPDKRFPVKPYSPQKLIATAQSPSIEDVLRDNEGLTKAIEIMEARNSDIEGDLDETLKSVGITPATYNESNIDDTMISTFSNFSAIPETTTYSKLKHSSPKSVDMDPASTQVTPKSNRSSLYNYTHKNSRDDDNSINLLEMTEPLESFSGRTSPIRLSRLAAFRSSRLLNGISTPSSNRHIMPSIIDFDIPPAPTPRSLPTITPRELESLKSKLLSEISSLKACLSGKDAEVLSLKDAVADAEKRVGESLEQVREEQNQKEQLASDLEDWEKRGREMEVLLRNFKEKIVQCDQDREELEGRLEECEARRQAAEHMAQEAESKLAAMKTGKPSPEPESKSDGALLCTKSNDLAVEQMTREIHEKINLDLHALYKEKHETKVAALKKSYERRWDKNASELEKKIEDLTKENIELKSASNRDTESNSGQAASEAAQNSKLQALETKVESLTQNIMSIQNDNSELQKLLDAERSEKGKLVQTVEEMIPLITSFDDLISNLNKTPPACAKCSAQPVVQSPNVDNFRRSLSKTSGLRAPSCHSGLGESRIGKGNFTSAHQEKARSRSISTLARPNSGLSHRSGIFSNIEKMGNYKGKGDR
ncbi:hypothetical protein K3495_g7197 [Podosphaera aphanis]|nr:hypothetical protein K3495_g7197 [Podosphaera aphanis]